MSPVWRIVEGLPIKRLTYEDQHSVTWRIRPGQLMHQTVYDECIVENLPPDMAVEPDEFATAGRFILVDPEALWEREILDRSSNLASRTLLSSESGRQALLDRVHDISRSIDNTALICWQRRHDGRSERLLGSLASIHHNILNGRYGRVGEFSRLSDALGNLEPPADDCPVFPFGLRGHAGGVTSVAFVAPTLVVSGSFDHTLRMWDVEAGTAVGEPAAGHTGRVHCLAVSPNGRVIASGSEDGSVRTWALDGRRLAATGAVMRAPAPTPGAVLSLAFSPDGARIAVGSELGTVTIWDTATSQIVGEVLDASGGAVSALAFCPGDMGSARLLTGDEKVRVWDTQTGQQLGDEVAVRPADDVLSLAYAPDGATLAVGVSSGFTHAAGTIPGTVRIWDAQTLAQRHVLVGHTDWVWCVAFSPDGRHVASGGADNTVRIWNAVSGGPVGVLRGHTSRSRRTGRELCRAPWTVSPCRTCARDERTARHRMYT